jgi:pSer/pThr/pTyr-binding forkhead associated (FHA) protein
MYGKLLCKTGQFAGKVYEFDDELSIGNTAENTIHIPSGIVSARHARIFFDSKKGDFFLEDLGSYNGTKLDGKDIHGKKKLKESHFITLANTFEFVFQIVKGKDMPEKKAAPVEHQPVAPRQPRPHVPDVPAPISAAAAKGAEADVGHKTVLDFGFSPMPSIPEVTPQKKIEAPPKPAEPAKVAAKREDSAPTMFIDPGKFEEEMQKRAPAFHLEFTSPKGEKKSAALKEGENKIGRLSTSDIPIDDASMSRNHALVTVKMGTLRIKDLGSKNGTFVGDQQLSSEIELTPDQPIRFGLVKATIVRTSA